jgi:SNF2 family DNA or RNA helicase
MNEFKKWAPFMRVVNLIPTLEMRDDIIRNYIAPGKYDVILTTYDGVRICHSTLKKISW